MTQLEIEKKLFDEIMKEMLYKDRIAQIITEDVIRIIINKYDLTKK